MLQTQRDVVFLAKGRAVATKVPGFFGFSSYRGFGWNAPLLMPMQQMAELTNLALRASGFEYAHARMHARTQRSRAGLAQRGGQRGAGCGSCAHGGDAAQAAPAGERDGRAGPGHATHRGERPALRGGQRRL